MLVHLLVHASDKINRFQVLMTAVLVWNPFALPASVIEVEHGSYGVDAQIIDMITVEPEHGVADQKALHLRTAIVENVALPFGMIALARVGMLVKMRAVEECQAMLVGGEVRRHPIKNNPDIVLVQIIDQVHQVLRRAVVPGGGKVTGDLVSP